MQPPKWPGASPPVNAQVWHFRSVSMPFHDGNDRPLTCVVSDFVALLPEHAEHAFWPIDARRVRDGRRPIGARFALHRWAGKRVSA
jgi:hypothetical protein